MYRRLILSLVATMALVSHVLTLEAEAGWRHRRCRPAPMRQARPAPVHTDPYRSAPIHTAPPSGARDPGGFLVWINSVRASSGLGAVAWSDDLAADASRNSATGFGHHFMGRARRQNAGQGPLGAVQSAWLASPAHASAILDPSITMVGLAGIGNVWTYSAR
jgi:hypothetical protein